MTSGTSTWSRSTARLSMSRWLFDTDVLLDVALTRTPHAGSSAVALNSMQQGPEEAFIAWHTASNLYYNARKALGGLPARVFVSGLLDFVQVAPTSTDDLRYALSLPMADFEDAMQVAAARACEADFIVTRNEGDFAGSPIPTLTPADALAELRR